MVSLDWSHGRPEPIEGSEREIPAQFVLIAMGFTGPEADAFDALGVSHTDARGVRPVVEAGTHKAQRTEGAAGAPVYVAGDARSGSSLVVTALADGLACAAEVAADLGI